MSGDFSRDTFDRRKHYRAVTLQQGRLQLDADWNEAVDQELYRLRATAADVAGAAAAVGSGFQIVVQGGSLKIEPGRLYAGGLLCELAGETPLDAQPNLPGVPLPTAAGTYLAYLDVWERAITAVEDPDLLEPALGGQDTTVRTRAVCQVRILTPAVAANSVCSSFSPFWAPSGDPPPAPGRLRARANGSAPFPDRAYRVEVHAAGNAGAATFKWARDNASVAAAVATLSGTVVTLAARPGLAAGTLFASGDWVEATDDGRVLRGEPGVLGQVTAVDPAARTLTVASWSGGTPALGPGALVRRWNGGVRTLTAPGFFPLESGVEVEFAAGPFRTGDAWLVASRAAGVLWPVSAGAAVFKDPDAIRHTYAPLAILKLSAAGNWSVVSDCRQTFSPITETLDPNKVDRGGDSMTGKLTIESDLTITGNVQIGSFDLQPAGVPPVSGATVPPRLSVSGGALQPDATQGIVFANGADEASLRFLPAGGGGKLVLDAITGTTLTLRQGGADTLVVNTAGQVGIIQPSPRATLDALGQTRATGLQVTGALTFVPGAEDGFVLTSDATGGATWQPLPIEAAGSPAFFETPIEVATGTAAIGWTAFSFPAGKVPTDASAAILEAEARENDQEFWIQIRRNNGSPTLLLLRARAAGSSDDFAWANQGIFPLDSGSFEYQVFGTVTSFSPFAWKIRAVGYFL
ncbi:MAG TPA: DUF6519 domain-containing protein [Thermoanaerobaculia bacterium]|nr:DUF6519 domain-containing protein [Thermoanaerobaculia bacterium]